VKTIFRRAIIMILAIATALPSAANAGPSKHSLNEDRALKLLIRILTRDQVYAKRISLNCVTFDTEEKRDPYFEIALREKHTADCGGDPDTAPVVARYRVYRLSGKIEWLNTTENNWQPYNPKKIK
jgi:hypothetical protein